MIIGHQKQWDSLKRSIDNNRIAHAYLFCGPSKIGKKKIAFQFIKLLAGLDQDRILPDLLIVEPECSLNKKGEIKESLRAIIHISKIRELKSKLFLSSIGGGYKAAIIDEAPAMTADAQGALLKLLEEPKEKTIIILLAQHLEELLPTIVSRCQIILFGLLPNREIEEYLSKQKVSIEKIKELSWLSFGKPGLAIEYLNNSSEEKFQKAKIKEINEIIRAPLKVRFQYAQKLSQERIEMNKALEVWLNYFRELLLDNLGNGRLPSSFQGEHHSTRNLKKNINLIEKIKSISSNINVNSRLVLEILLMKIQ